ncbi:FAD-dependent oxidoreductase [Mangrovimonas yunxiaonensis]|uniref:FAD-dependent oxidoreductase n=1 Tax=Mangrovimonas yunxiaonensis TaxID=1197477 RepID=A0A084TLZ7_9FLAO|nr:FAD-dependent oxidoreductase [Mangrovimonas yunxiaonensis]KFB01733.1 FAD-dependent oxidoreductase [Mangrovimonas yunxiaonensis]GGH40666.1 FAD-dependent oxidoreductase [Mangrovimonas yunxiaonensis]
MTVDYLIVGCGLAGVHFCHTLKQNQKSFVVFDNGSQQSSTVAGGLYNPVVLKRFTPVWKSDEQLTLAAQVYPDLERLLAVKLDYKLPVKRLFHSVEEQNNWFVAADKYGLQKYLSPNIISNTNSSITAPYGLGEVLHTGRIDTDGLISSFKQYVADAFIAEAFDYDSLQLLENSVSYKGIKAKNVVFAEGFGLKKNPYFNTLPLNGTKGELLTIHAPDLNIDFVLKSNAFLIPLGADLYKLGATYNWTDKTNRPSEAGKTELLTKVKTFLNCDFNLVGHEAGIRPTVKDRRPLVGQHSSHKALYVLNGLGTRGVMIAPYVAQQLFNFIEKHAALDPEINIARFTA